MCTKFHCELYVLKRAWSSLPVEAPLRMSIYEYRRMSQWAKKEKRGHESGGDREVGMNLVEVSGENGKGG